ncbi:MAG TPA: stage 0 sporulation protein [Anaerolineaceae bacterium]|nr:stage 0 sporulation protein [Anaerolineales bacterium]HIQ09596.1 stage 0 sporulation protein [Anaerolineaceae bacterium]
MSPLSLLAEMPPIVGIRFRSVGRVYHYDAPSCPDLQVGEFVLVETQYGLQVGEVVQRLEPPPEPPEEGWREVLRRASAADLTLRRLIQQKEAAALVNCRAKAAALGGYEGVKFVAAEISLDERFLTILYNIEEGRPEMRPLLHAMRRLYPKMKVDFRRIGPRDVAKLLGGMGACGMEERCCSRFLTEFSPISIKMAKAQGISLTPTEITGMCGRLRCCLIYEYEIYVEAHKTLPKLKKRVKTPEGEGKVVDLYPLKQVVVVELDGMRREFHRDKLEPWDENEAQRRATLPPCANGDCPRRLDNGAQPVGS